MADGDGNSGQKPKEQEEERYEAEYLVRNAVSLLDSRPTFVAGALALSDRKTHTIAQGKELLKQFHRRTIEPDEGAA